MFYFQATVAQYKAEVMELQSALPDAETSRRDISQKLTKTKEENEILWGAVSQIECALNSVTQVKQEETELKEDLEAQTVQVSHVGTLLH